MWLNKDKECCFEIRIYRVLEQNNRCEQTQDVYTNKFQAEFSRLGSQKDTKMPASSTIQGEDMKLYFVPHN